MRKKHKRAVKERAGLSCFTGNYYLFLNRLIDVCRVRRSWVMRQVIYGICDVWS